ncbi:hypothetical protein RIF29_22471 [Crotalaria pallida]|uniref:Uncharacterized protein n=1 Tax=Crotalaria pallida TaxID=3830 RepID=A0AAN9F6D9_CROPI
MYLSTREFGGLLVSSILKANAGSVESNVFGGDICLCSSREDENPFSSLKQKLNRSHEMPIHHTSVNPNWVN